MARKIPFRRPQGYVADVPEAFRTVSEKPSEKGPEVTLDPLFPASEAAKWGCCDPFHRLLRLQFEAYQDFSYGFRMSVIGNAGEA